MVHVYDMYTCVRNNVRACREHRKIVCPALTLALLLRPGLSLKWGQGWLTAGKTQQSRCLLSSVLGLHALQGHTQPFTGLAGIQCRSLCVHSEHFYPLSPLQL